MKKTSNHTIYKIIKRILDIIFSFLLIVLLSWLFVILTILNLIFAKGHPYFLDSRVGYKNKDIKVLKFTTMIEDAEEKIDELLSEEQKESWETERKVDDDPRVTKFGNILRKTSLDELPQLMNIFLGTLSFVGPRPITRKELEMHYTEEERNKLLSVKPGLTGNWAVNGRNKKIYKDHQRQELELKYIDHFSFVTDVKIVLKTFLAVLRFQDVK